MTARQMFAHAKINWQITSILGILMCILIYIVMCTDLKYLKQGFP